MQCLALLRMIVVWHHAYCSSNNKGMFNSFYVVALSVT